MSASLPHAASWGRGMGGAGSSTNLTANLPEALAAMRGSVSVDNLLLREGGAGGGTTTTPPSPHEGSAHGGGCAEAAALLAFVHVCV